MFTLKALSWTKLFFFSKAEVYLSIFIFWTSFSNGKSHSHRFTIFKLEVVAISDGLFFAAKNTEFGEEVKLGITGTEAVLQIFREIIVMLLEEANPASESHMMYYRKIWKDEFWSNHGRNDWKRW